MYQNLFRLSTTDASLADAALDLAQRLKFQGVTIVTEKNDIWATGVTGRLHSALQRDGNLVEIQYKNVASVEDSHAVAHEIQVLAAFFSCEQVSHSCD